MAQPEKRVAAIDVGTNSIHMIIAESRGSEHRLLDRKKKAVQPRQSLDGQPTDRGLHGPRRGSADEIIAVTTSAVREAPNWAMSAPRPDTVRRRQSGGRAGPEPVVLTDAQGRDRPLATGHTGQSRCFSGGEHPLRLTSVPSALSSS